jgi:uncharacterized protein YicC (UPF0701 family)
MIRSMTAFARASGEQAGAELTWELRSVNHRYLEACPKNCGPWSLWFANG